MKTPKYVIYEESRFRVLGVEVIDEKEYYELKVGDRNAMVAPIEDCTPDEKPRKRKIKADGYVLEFDVTTGEIAVRRAGGRKRYQTSLAAIFSMTVKANVALEKALRKAKRKLNRGGFKR